MVEYPGWAYHAPSVAGGFVQLPLTQEQRRSLMLPQELLMTSEPVWPEDQRVEDAERLGRGLVRVPDLDAFDASDAISAIRVGLPDVLNAGWPHPTPEAPNDAASAPRLPAVMGVPHIPGEAQRLLTVPTSFSAPESIILRRLRLHLTLSSRGGHLPVALALEPLTEVNVNVHEVGDVSIDPAEALRTLFPQLPPLFTAHIGGKLNRTKVKPKIQASGLMHHECWWRVADTKIAYGFNPSLLVQFPAVFEFRVAASLHVEVRKRVLGVFHKTYAKSALPRTYVLRHLQDAQMRAEDNPTSTDNENRLNAVNESDWNGS
jgi:hypothetical protein